MDSYQDLWNSLPNIDIYFQCQECHQRFLKGWLQASPMRCLFCRSYRAVEYLSRSDLIRDAEWAFIQSGEEEKGRFYSDYLSQIHRWSTAMGLPYTAEDAWCEQQLLERMMEED